MSVKIEVSTPGYDNNYHITLAEAKRLTASNQARWDGPRKIIRAADTSNRCIWEPKPSGGYNVLQLR